MITRCLIAFVLASAGFEASAQDFVAKAEEVLGIAGRLSDWDRSKVTVERTEFGSVNVSTPTLNLHFYKDGRFMSMRSYPGYGVWTKKRGERFVDKVTREEIIGRAWEILQKLAPVPEELKLAKVIGIKENGKLEKSALYGGPLGVRFEYFHDGIPVGFMGAEVLFDVDGGRAVVITTSPRNRALEPKGNLIGEATAKSIARARAIEHIDDRFEGDYKDRMLKAMLTIEKSSATLAYGAIPGEIRADTNTFQDSKIMPLVYVVNMGPATVYIHAASGDVLGGMAELHEHEFEGMSETPITAGSGPVPLNGADALGERSIKGDASAAAKQTSGSGESRAWVLVAIAIVAVVAVVSLRKRLFLNR